MTEKRKKPYFNLNPANYLADKRLRVCSAAARGVWIDMECVMHDASDYGYLVINDDPATDEQVARLIGISLEEYSKCLAELEQRGIALRRRDGVIYSRRLLDNQKISNTAAKNGKNGGNPSLRKDKGNSARDNPPDNPPDNHRKGKVKVKDIKENSKKEKPREDLWFEGKVIQLTKPEYFQWLELSGLQEAAFKRLLIGRDGWYVDHPEATATWFAATVTKLENINGGE